MHPVARLVVLIGALSAGGSALGQDMLVSSRFTNNILRYDSITGAFRGVFAQGPELANPNGIAYGPDGNLYVGLGDGNRILRYHGQTGAYLGEFTQPAAGGMGSVRGIEFGPDGNLYVASAANHSVLRFNGTTGAFLGVAASGSGLNGPVGLALGPSNEVYVSGALSNQVYLFQNNAFVRSFNAGPTYGRAVGMAFAPDGRLLVAQSITNEILSFNVPLGTFNSVFVPPGSLDIPIYMETSPNGHLYVGSFNNDSVVRINAATGQVLGVVVPSGSGGSTARTTSPSCPSRPRAAFPPSRASCGGPVAGAGPVRSWVGAPGESAGKPDQRFGGGAASLVRWSAPQRSPT